MKSCAASLCLALAALPHLAAARAPFAARGEGLDLGLFSGSNSTARTADFRLDLSQWRWTMLVGDSILLSQFLALAEELKAKPAEDTLSQFQPCADPASGNSFPSYAAMFDFALTPNEFWLTCEADACRFHRVGCMNLFEQHCRVVEGKTYCHEPCKTNDEWNKMVASIEATVAKPSSFAVSFHWAPSHVNEAFVMQRFQESTFLPQALVWNNCHHWFGNVAANPQEKAQKVSTWTQFLQQESTLLKQVVHPSSFAYQGCARLRCVPNDMVCAALDQDLVAANQHAYQVMAGQSVSFIDLQTMLPPQVVQAAFFDGRHPCFPLPCMWGDEQDDPARQCCKSLVQHSLYQLNALGSAGAPSQMAGLFQGRPAPLTGPLDEDLDGDEHAASATGNRSSGAAAFLARRAPGA